MTQVIDIARNGVNYDKLIAECMQSVEGAKPRTRIELTEEEKKHVLNRNVKSFFAKK